MRIVADTNLIISRTLSATGAAAEIMRRWQQGQFELLVSAPILGEYRRALAYERVRARHGLDDDALDTLVAGLAEYATLIEPQERLAVVEADPDDDKFIECALAGQASYVVTRDEHLLAIGAYQGIAILPPGDFLALLKSAD